MITKKYYKLIRVSHEDSEYMRLKNVSNEAGIFKMLKTGNPTAPNLEYSIDGVTWTTYDFSTLPEVAVAAGANIYFRGTNANQQFNRGSGAYVSFSFNKTCEGHGNMCSIFDPDPAVFSTINSVGEYGLNNCFRGCTSLTAAPDFSNVTSIGNYGLNNCFRGCTSLTAAPDLSNVTSIGNYGLYDAFDGCTSLTTAPDLSNITTVGQEAMSYCFNGCTSLTTPPDLSSVTSIGQGGMSYCFSGCRSLTTPPDLSSVTSIGQGGIRDCFYDCRSLTTGPDLSNVTTVGSTALFNCFNTCFNIATVTAPNVSDLTQNNILGNWLNSAGTQATGTKVVRVPTGATITTDSTSGIPTGWTRVDY